MFLDLQATGHVSGGKSKKRTLFLDLGREFV